MKYKVGDIIEYRPSKAFHVDDCYMVHYKCRGKIIDMMRKDTVCIKIDTSKPIRENPFSTNINCIKKVSYQMQFSFMDD